MKVHVYIAVLMSDIYCDKRGCDSVAESKYNFERLTPTGNVNIDVYVQAIDFVFKHPDIKNVAISGAYSAGKSSVLESYKNRHGELNFLHISLAHFQSPNKKKNEEVNEKKNEEPEVKESVLEGKILNQLIHQIPSDKIPQTNFRVKKRIGTESIIAKTCEIIVFLATIIYFLCFDWWKSYVSTLPVNRLKTILELSTHPYALMINGIILIGLLWLFIYGLIKIQKNKNVFRKLNLQGNEIEIFEESDDSYFDKYLNEVLYLFENADADVIVFEDMDRFNANRIFERLREVNTLANIQLQKENKKVLRFFYLLRDDIFTSKDRTKFFDYIIPIVPVVDGSNSYDQIISHFKKSGFFEKFDKNFLQGLSLYIDDMRLLKNIYNEFVIYFNRLNITELDCNKMLAIIAYKNLFPRDFADLQLNQGFVYTLFTSKKIFVEEETKKLIEQISEKEHEIILSQNEHLKKVRELDVVFEDKKPTNYRYKGDLSEEDQIEYLERKQALENKLNNKIPAIKDEKFALERELVLLKSKQLKDIITRENISFIFNVKSTNEIGTVTDFNEIKSSEYFDLLKYLIRSGYIDETYADYMTYFYENSLSRIDKTFLRSVTDKKAKEYTYQLKNPQMVVSRLRLVDFDQEEILNFSLLTYLLHTQTYVEYLERFIDQLKETNNFKFIGTYFDVTSEMPAYIKYMNIMWPEAFYTALSNQSLSESQIRKYSIYSLYYSDENTIELVNKSNCLCDYISNSRDYLAIEDADIDKLIHGFKSLEVCFVGFDYETLNQELFHAVCQESLYEINAENLELIETKILNINNNDDILHKNYTLLLSHPDSAITQYMNRNINKYFDVVLQICKETIVDDENVAVLVLNNPEITMENKRQYISFLQTHIVSINEIVDHDLWPQLLDADIVQYSERNIMDSFNGLKLSESVISFINRCDLNLDFSKLEYEESIRKNFFICLIECGAIINSKYEEILVSLGWYYANFSIKNISDDKIMILINTSIIKMTEDNLKSLRENYPDQVLSFIRKNIEKYVNIMSSDLFSQEELLEILSWEISDEFKIKLLEFSDNAISVIGKNYSTEVCLYILNNNFENSDLMSLFSSFEQWDDLIQAKIFDYAVRSIPSIINNLGDVSEKLKDNLLHTDKLDKSIKIDLFVAMIPTLSPKQIDEGLTLLDLSQYSKIFDERSRPKFEIGSESKKLLDAFQKKGLIYDYEEDQNREGYYKVVRKKQINSK